MNARKLVGYLCVAFGFALIALLGYGVIEPVGGRAAAPASMQALLLGLLPSVAIALAAFLLGLWLLKGPRRRGGGRR